MIAAVARRLTAMLPARAAMVAAFMVAAPSMTVPAGLRHPLHTTLAVVTLARDGGVDVSLRAFVDDYTTAARAHSRGATVTDDVLTRYARSSFTILDAQDNPVRFQPCGVRFEADLVWICLKGAARPAARLRAMNRMLFETFADQVNIVQVVRDGRRASILFTRGDAAKWLAP